MKITAIEAIPVRVPKVKPFKSSLGVNTAANSAIVRIHTDEGLTGTGEICLIWHGDGARLCRDVDEILAPALVGEDPLRIAHIHRRMAELFKFGRHTLPVRAGIDMALHDVAGKVLNTPAYNLLGGKVRDRVELSMSIHMASLDEMVEQARDYHRRGFGTVKVKVGIDEALDVAVVSAIRQALGDRIKIRVDANMGWKSAKDALRVIRRLEPLGVISVEQPLRPRDLAGLAFLRERTDLPIMVDESVWEPEDAWDVITARAADIINVYAAESGGLYPAARILHAAELAGIVGCIGSMPEFGIGTAAQGHLAAAVPNVGHPADVAGSLYQGDDLIVEELEIRDGHYIVNDRPGLGVTLDEAALERNRLDR